VKLVVAEGASLTRLGFAVSQVEHVFRGGIPFET